MKYKVRFMMDNTYEVVEVLEDEWSERYSCFQGRLADCEAYIRLHEGGYM